MTDEQQEGKQNHKQEQTKLNLEAIMQDKKIHVRHGREKVARCRHNQTRG